VADWSSVKEYGEALEREFMEELNVRVRDVSHYYTTDIFVASAFNPRDQLISVYYLVEDVPLGFGADQ
jgi:8-oxo-dGTP diphosphatase